MTCKHIFLYGANGAKILPVSAFAPFTQFPSRNSQEQWVSLVTSEAHFDTRALQEMTDIWNARIQAWRQTKPCS